VVVEWSGDERDANKHLPRPYRSMPAAPAALQTAKSAPSLSPRAEADPPGPTRTRMPATAMATHTILHQAFCPDSPSFPHLHPQGISRPKPRLRVRLGRAGQKRGPARGRTAKADGRGVRNDVNPAQIWARFAWPRMACARPLASGRWSPRLPRAHLSVTRESI
jgi:hypothetical protein